MKRMVYLLLGLGLAAALCVWWETAVFSRTAWQSDGSRVEYRENARGDVLHEARYDETGRWESAVDYRYDALGRVTRVDRHPSGVYERYTYGDGTATVEQFRLSGESMQTQSLTLDSYGRTTRSKTVFADGISSGETRFTYGADGQHTVENYDTDGTMTSAMTFDKSGRLLRLETVGAFSTLYFYEEPGLRTEHYDALGAPAGGSLSFYDGRGLAVRVEEYDARGTLTAFYESDFTDAGMLSERRSYGADGTLTSRCTCFYDEDGAYLGCERQSGEKLRRYGGNDRALYD